MKATISTTTPYEYSFNVREETKIIPVTYAIEEYIKAFLSKLILVLQNIKYIFFQYDNTICKAIKIRSGSKNTFLILSGNIK